MRVVQLRNQEMLIPKQDVIAFKSLKSLLLFLIIETISTSDGMTDKIDKFGAKVSANLIAMIKIAIPQMACNVVDRAIQAFGGMGVSQDTPLASFYVYARAIRLADGPDEVHMYQLGRNLVKEQLTE